MWKAFIVFLILNFGCLYLGSLFTQTQVQSNWYVQLNKAPWTPPGWMFGVAWTFIMLCFSFYMAKLWVNSANKKSVIILFITQAILNVVWSPLFFTLHYLLFSLIVISILTLCIWYIGLKFLNNQKIASLLILPYAAWLIIATSLNAYALLMN